MLKFVADCARSAGWAANGGATEPGVSRREIGIRRLVARIVRSLWHVSLCRGDYASIPARAPCVIGLVTAIMVLTVSQAGAVIIRGDPDHSSIFYFFIGGDFTTPPDGGNNILDYSSPNVWVFAEGNDLGVGSMTWSAYASLEHWFLRASVAGSSGFICSVEHDRCHLHRVYPTLRLEMGDRVFIDQPITAPIDVTVRLSVDGFTAAPPGGAVEANIILNADTQPFTPGDIYRSQDTGPTSFVLEEIVRLTPDQTWFDVLVLMQLGVFASPDDPLAQTILDFSNTAYLDVILPAGYTFHSEGGFAGRDAMAVAEPVALALFVTGLLGLGLIRRRVF